MSDRVPVNLRAMIVGFGKCGSRICYDVFACSQGKPLSYNLRTNAGGLVDKLAQALDRKIQSLISTVFGANELPLQVKYAIVDSDQENEVGGYIQFINENQPAIPERRPKGLSFPGERFQLGQHSSGCDYGIVSEAIARQTKLDVGFDDPSTIRIWATALGGGTGSGSSLEVIKDYRKHTQGSLRHNLVIGILPAEVSGVVDGSMDIEPEKTAAINAGRFLVKWLASYDNPDGRGDGLMLASNSTADAIATGNANLFLPESLVNAYCARAIFQIANANSRFVACTPDFDAVEMTNRFSGGLILVGQAYEKIEASIDKQINRQSAQEVMRRALSNPILVNKYVATGDISGLSIPLRKSELNELGNALKSGHNSEAVAAEKTIPLEFRSAQTVVVLAAFAASGDLAVRKSELSSIANQMFSNSDVQIYEMESKTSFDNIVVLIINPFIRQVQRLIYSYITHSWAKVSVSRDSLGHALDSLLTSGDPVATSGKPTVQVSRVLAEVVNESETVEASVLGDQTQKLLSQYPGEPVSLAVLAKALERMRQFYNHSRKRTPRSSI